MRGATLPLAADDEVTRAQAGSAGGDTRSVQPLGAPPASLATEPGRWGADAMLQG